MAIVAKHSDKEWLVENYSKTKRSLDSVGKLAGVSGVTIWKNMARLNIPRRKCGPICWNKRMRKAITAALKNRKPIYGRKLSIKSRLKMSNERAGSGNGNWKGGITFHSRKFRKSSQYRKWRIAVLKRDNYRCKYKGCNKPCNIAHHKKTAKEFPELRVVVRNGMAVCEEHHKLIHKLLKQKYNGKR